MDMMTQALLWHKQVRFTLCDLFYGSGALQGRGSFGATGICSGQRHLAEMAEQALAQALQSLSQVLTDMQSRPQTDDASRYIQKPEVWKPANMEEELNGWPEWSFLFRAFVEFSVPQYNLHLNRIEADLNAVLELSDYSTPVQERAQFCIPF